jgi:glc operon protein GlcG
MSWIIRRVSAKTTNFRQHHDALDGALEGGDRTMRPHVWVTVIATAAALVLAGTGWAQQPTPPAPVPTPITPPDYGSPINNEQAKSVANAAFAEAKKNNWRMAFTIVGPSGEPIYFEKMDGTQHASAEISRAKARTAVFFRRPTKAFADQFAAGNMTFMTFPDAPIASEGGVLILQNGKIVGAIGVSGGTGQQDGVAAAAGANALK